MTEEDEEERNFTFDHICWCRDYCDFTEANKKARLLLIELKKKLKEDIPALRDAGMRVEFKIPRGYNTDLEKQVSEQISAE